MRLSFLTVFALALIWSGSTVSAQTSSNEYIEVFQFQGVDVARLAILDRYLEKGLLPALNRIGVETVGVFKDVEEVEGKTSIYLIHSLKRPQQIAELMTELAKDKAFQESAKEYFNVNPKEPLYSRVRSELLVAFDCMPKIAIPKQKLEKKDRFFELRTYESANELMGIRKVDMFNSGEVPIFLDCGIQPVFFGQAVVGDRMPNLTYMTVYDNADQMAECWKKFRDHPEWKKFSALEKYQGTVSKIHKTSLLPRPYSQL